MINLRRLPGSYLLQFRDFEDDFDGYPEPLWVADASGLGVSRKRVRLSVARAAARLGADPPLDRRPPPPRPSPSRGNLSILKYLMTYRSGQVFLEHLLLSCYPSQMKIR